MVAAVAEEPEQLEGLRQIVYGRLDDKVTEPWPSQERFHAIRERFKGFSGPVGSGKSKALCFEALSLSYENRGCMGLIGAPTYPMLRDVTRLAFLELLDESHVPHRFLKQENAIYLPEAGGSQIVFRTVDNPDRLRGPNLAWFGLDEATYCSQAAWQRLEARLREPKAKRLCGFAVWTPRGYDWIYTRFRGSEKVKGYELVLAEPGENKALPDDFYDRLAASYDERFYRQEVLGEYLNVFAGQVYYAFDRAEHVREIEYNPEAPLLWSLDFNVDPMCAVVCQALEESLHVQSTTNGSRPTQTRLHVLNELQLPDSNTEAACEAFLERTEPYRARRSAQTPVYVYGDATGQARQGGGKSNWRIVKDFFARHPDKFRPFYRIPSANPGIRDRVNGMNGKLRSHRGDIGLTVHPQCKGTIKDLEQVAWKTDTYGNTLADIDKTKDHNLSHLSDALGYLVWREFGQKIKGGYRSEYIGV